MVPIQLDWIAFFILTGIVQSVVLTAVFLSGERRRVLANRFLGLFLIAGTITGTEVFLCYTGYIQYAIHLIDTAEPFNFTIAPLAYFYIYSRLNGQSPPYKWLHFLPFFLYFLYCWFFWLQPMGEKINAFRYAYHPDMPYVDVAHPFSPDPLGIKRYVRELTFSHFLLYVLLSIVVILKTFRQQVTVSPDTLRWLRHFLLQFGAAVLFFMGISFVFDRDLGDPFIEIIKTILIYFITFNVLRHSNMLQPEVQAVEKEKYVNSSLRDNDKTLLLQKITTLMDNEKPYLDNLFSMSELAKRVSATPHHVSQVLNEMRNQTFFEFLAEYRIHAAKILLHDPHYQNLKIEEIAEQVGYNSKSAFNTAFKRITGMTPSAFKNSTTEDIENT
ncbi:MAG: helix-turn-helix domain-containing protein [Saprospiraceae bacterium]